MRVTRYAIRDTSLGLLAFVVRRLSSALCLPLNVLHNEPIGQRWKFNVRRLMFEVRYSDFAFFAFASALEIRHWTLNIRFMSSALRLPLLRLLDVLAPACL
jgi:hypothetical protein